MPEPDDFLLFQNGLGARVFQKLTGRSANGLTSWQDLKRALEAFGASSDPRLNAIGEKGLGAVDFFSSSEALIVVPLLMLADHGRSADAIAQTIGWWSDYPRVADRSTRSLIAKLLTL